MMRYKILAFLLLIAIAPLTTQAQVSYDLFFYETNQFFNKYVEEGAVDYAAIKENPVFLDKLVDKVAAFETRDTDPRLDFPFYVNAYNLLVIHQVVDSFPIASPMDIDGFFDKTTFTIAGKSQTLNQLENDIIRPVYGDSRIHFALVCAAQSCPKLPSEGFTSENYHNLLNARTAKALNDTTFIRIDDKESTVAISKIFEWYKEDFGKDDDALINFINRFRRNPIPRNYSVTYYDYDWSLNAPLPKQEESETDTETPQIKEDKKDIENSEKTPTESDTDKQ